MNLKVWLAAIAVSAGMATASFAQVTGKVTLEGKPGDMPAIDMSGNKDCAAKHADPVADPTVTANDKGELANVIVSIKKEEGQELAGEAPKEAAVLDQEGCMYKPHVLAMMTGQELSIKEDRGADSGSQGQQDDDAFAILAGAESDLGHSSGVRIVHYRNRASDVS